MTHHPPGLVASIDEVHERVPAKLGLDAGQKAAGEIIILAGLDAVAIRDDRGLAAAIIVDRSPKEPNTLLAI
jgi:hypothetical protein